MASMSITKETHPALWQILHRDADLTGYDGRPSMCDSCPLAKLDESKNFYEGISNDESEAYYMCDLLKQSVWGENPKCSPADWMARARTEIGLSAQPNGEHNEVRR